MADEVTTKGIGRLAYQFKDSTDFQAFITAFLQELQDLYTSGNQLLEDRYLDTAEGLQLDGIGEIIGLERPITGISVAGVFGFLDDPTSLGFGTLLDPDIGGNFWNGLGTEVLIGDNLYRMLIKAKIIENQTAMTVDDTLRLISYTFGGAPVRYMLPSNLHPRYDIGKILDAFEINLLPELPVLIGIESVDYHTMWIPETSFAFYGDDDGLGFGSLTDANVGGTFASIII